MLHNGGGSWDNADGVSGRNYVATRAGTYRLAHGMLTLLPPRLPLMLVRCGSGAVRRTTRSAHRGRFLAASRGRRTAT